MRVDDEIISKPFQLRAVDDEYLSELEVNESNIVVLDTITRLDIPAERVLNQALERDLEQVVILGYDKEGGEYMCSSMASGPEIIWLLERLKHILISGELVDYE